MSGMRSIKNSGYSAPITGLVLFIIWEVQSLVLNNDWIGRDSSDEVLPSLAEFLHSLTGQYKGCTC